MEVILRIGCCCWDSQYWPSLCEVRSCLLLGVPFNKVLLISWAYFWPELVLLHFLVFCCSLVSHWSGTWCKLVPCRACVNVSKGLFLKMLHFSFLLLALLETPHGIAVAAILLEPWSSLANWRCNSCTFSWPTGLAQSAALLATAFMFSWPVGPGKTLNSSVLFVCYCLRRASTAWGAGWSRTPEPQCRAKHHLATHLTTGSHDATSPLPWSSSDLFVIFVWPGHVDHGRERTKWLACCGSWIWDFNESL